MVIATIESCSGDMRALQEVEEDVLQAGGDGSNSIDGCGMLLRGFAEALHDGIEPEMLANAALFAALADLIGVHGEDAVARMTNGLSRRIHHGEFTLKRTAQ